MLRQSLKENALPLDALEQCWNAAPLECLASSGVLLVLPALRPSLCQAWVHHGAEPAEEKQKTKQVKR